MPAGEQLPALAILGGTGPEGRGLAVRWAYAGHTVYIGSRSRERAADAADRIREQLGGEGPVHAVTNRGAAERGRVIVLAVPYEAQRPLLEELHEVIGDKLVICVVNPITFDDLGPRAVPVPEGSAAEQCQALLPRARVVSAFHHVPAQRLWHVDQPVTCDVLLCGDDGDAKQTVADLTARIRGMSGVDCGPLRLSAYVENLTAVILSINRRYRIQAGLKIDGLPYTATVGGVSSGGRQR